MRENIPRGTNGINTKLNLTFYGILLSMCRCTHHDDTGGCKLEIVSPELSNLLIKHLSFFSLSLFPFLFFRSNSNFDRAGRFMAHSV